MTFLDNFEVKKYISLIVVIENVENCVQYFSQVCFVIGKKNKNKNSLLKIEK